MASVNLRNLARMTVSSSGTGTINLSAAVSGFLTFDLAGCSTASAGEVVRYAINDTTNSEIAYGTYTSSALTLTRGSSTNGMISTNSNSPINMSNAAQVFITPHSRDFPWQVDTANTIATTSLAVTIGGAAIHSSTTTVGAAITYGGVTLSNAVTGTGNMVLSASPTLTGTLTAAAITASGVVSITNNTAATSAVTGALVVTGGVGVTGAVWGASGCHILPSTASAADTCIFGNQLSDASGANWPLAALIGNANQVSYGVDNSNITSQNFRSTVRASVAGMGSFNHIAADTTHLIVGLYGWVPTGGHGAGAVAGMFDRPDGSGNSGGSPYSIIFAGGVGAGSTVYAMQIYDWTAAGQTLSINGQGDILNKNGSYGTISDARFKKNIADAPSFLNRVMATNIRSFHLKGDAEDAPRRYGVLAQDEVDRWPSLILGTEDEYAFNYAGLTIPHIKAFQEYVGSTDSRLARIEKQLGLS